MVWSGRADVYAGGGLAAAGRAAQRSTCTPVVRLRGVDAERLRLGVPEIRSGEVGGLRRGGRAAFREHISAGQNSGFLPALGTELRREFLQAGSPRRLPQHDGRRGVQLVFARRTRDGLKSRAAVTALVGAGFQRRPDELGGRTDRPR